MFAAQQVPYQQTASFSRIVTDYLAGSENLKPFYSLPVSWDGLEEAIRRKAAHPPDRELLVSVLQDHYAELEPVPAVQQNIRALVDPQTFTVCTAHQPNLFTGPLYFIYKILHAIKLADALKERYPEKHFVPVFYMGSEDADLAELNHFTVQGKRYEWKTTQKGAVGRMLIDRELQALIDDLQLQIGTTEAGNEWISLLKAAYPEGRTIQDATRIVVHRLFARFGLVVLIADDPRLKKTMVPVFEQDLFRQTPSQVVEQSCNRLAALYPVQAHPREINLFYLKDDIRERIIKTKDGFQVHETSIQFTTEEMSRELREHPERFSPNVILRGLYQETLLPNIAFIGGGGELAYWLQLKDLFDQYAVPFPVLVLRNSFLIVEKKWEAKVKKLELSLSDFFRSEQDLLNLLVTREAAQKITLNGSFEKAEELFESIRRQAGAVDPTLAQHVAAIRARSLKTLQELEKKMLRAEKRKFSSQQQQIRTIKAALFPKNGLQERVENVSSFYAAWGPGILEAWYRLSPAIDQFFTILIRSEG